MGGPEPPPAPFPPPTRALSSRYDFTTGKPVQTEVVVARGVISNPAAAAFEIIPLASASSPLFVFTDETVRVVLLPRPFPRCRGACL